MEIAPETEARLRALVDEVLRVNQQFNLTAIRNPDEAWPKHVLDSLQALQTGYCEGRKALIDVGSGPGFPGLALAIARPDLKVTLLESTRKKCDFLRATIAQLAIGAKVLNERAEVTGQNRVWRERFDVVTARAVGSIGEICELTLPLAKVGGHIILWRGQRAPEEIKAAQSVLKTLGGVCRKTLPYQLPGHEMIYNLVVIEKNARNPPQFPRSEGLPKHDPLCVLGPQEKSLETEPK